ncbi:DRMBL-domain-containing protein [Lindgomyces ingoldianus]|uniref:DRMBL-domain-containing protein n=1 Tax=Lindgomyces ingoldianus TaxID=673940 RepID=A0ACB6QDH0_9PLEO|nr:DRMBL-domain-containing protein [Lindgomyces ingoldianus]KAF2465013.1 DRMBL-domain-containing protein [Lindgomyces ingoldianus]
MIDFLYMFSSYQGGNTRSTPHTDATGCHAEENYKVLVIQEFLNESRECANVAVGLALACSSHLALTKIACNTGSPALAHSASARSLERYALMFRNPRENRKLPPSSKLTPAVGRPPSPSRSRSISSDMAPCKTQTTLVPLDWSKRPLASNSSSRGKPKTPATGSGNGNIMAFFKKAEEINCRIFLEERGAKSVQGLTEIDEEDLGWHDEIHDASQERFNENDCSVKRRKIAEDPPVQACTPPPPESTIGAQEPPTRQIPRETTKAPRRSGPFLDDSESESEEMDLPIHRTETDPLPNTSGDLTISGPTEDPNVPTSHVDGPPLADPDPPLLKVEVSPVDEEAFDDFEGLVDGDFPEGEEYNERQWMEEQRRLEIAEAGIEGDFDDFDGVPMFLEAETETDEMIPSCPICGASLDSFSDQEASVHVNACLDGGSAPPPGTSSNKESSTPRMNSKIFKRPPRPAQPRQITSLPLGGAPTGPKSAFSTLMASHAEDAAWATAAAAESASRGKPSYQRTCPFYKILPGLYICVDAFRYGAVKDQNAYFLSHFHSDHYIGLTSSWSHGLIYCSKVTANLVRQQLRVDSKWVVDLEFETKAEIPNTEGVHVTMIPANHCPGSSLFLFEKEIGKGTNSRLQRILHCGDFRACQAHIEHPLLRPEVLDAAGGKDRQQNIDVCYLDTTYLNPKYAFPPQQQVIQACADMCVSLNKARPDETDSWEQVKKERAGEGMVKFVHRRSEAKLDEDDDEKDVDEMKATQCGSKNKRGRLLVVVGTYSIGKERICVGIAKALNSKIYAPPNKQKICRALEDPELNALLTTDPREAQVHMTPLFEIRAETLEDYLRDYRDQFSRAVGFRPSGWNYRPPNSRFTESPSVQTVLHSPNWKSHFSMWDLTPQRGSTSRASCFGVPYSEHSSFRELTMFCCALRISKIIPTVNVGSAKSREKMKAWCEKWATEKKKNGLFRLKKDGTGW